MGPPSLRPAKDNKTLGRHPPLQVRTHLFKDAIEFPVVGVCQWDFQPKHSPVYYAEAVYGEKRGIQRAKPHLSDQVRVISGNPAGIKPK